MTRKEAAAELARMEVNVVEQEAVNMAVDLLTQQPEKPKAKVIDSEIFRDTFDSTYSYKFQKWLKSHQKVEFLHIEHSLDEDRKPVIFVVFKEDKK